MTRPRPRCVQAFEHHPEDAGLRFHLSRLLQQQQRSEEALAAARRAIALDPQKPYWHEHLVKLLMEAGEDDEAEAALREAFEHHPDDAGLHFQLSRLLQRQQRLGGSPGGRPARDCARPTEALLARAPREAADGGGGG